MQQETTVSLRYLHADAPTCASCHLTLSGGVGSRQVYCEPCRQLRRYCAAVRRIVDEHPHLRPVASRKLGTTGAKPRRVSGGPRPAWRDERREIYAPYEVWAIPRYVATGYEISISAAARWILRVYGADHLSRRLEIVEGEVVGWMEGET